jgi:hypothetical protein
MMPRVSVACHGPLAPIRGSLARSLRDPGPLGCRYAHHHAQSMYRAVVDERNLAGVDLGAIQPRFLNSAVLPFGAPGARPGPSRHSSRPCRSAAGHAGRQQVIVAAGAHATAVVLVPPMLHLPLGELIRIGILPSTDTIGLSVTLTNR